MTQSEGKNCNELRFGLTTVKPNRAIKKCRIRNLFIEYYISEVMIVLVIPKSCSECNRIDDCTDDFILQITEKTYNCTDSDISAYFE